LYEHQQQSIQLTRQLFSSPKNDSAAGYRVTHYADLVRLQTAEALAVYERDYYAGRPAVTVNQFGGGSVYYLAARYEDLFLADFYGWLGNELGLEQTIPTHLPKGVTAQKRVTGSEETIFLLNFEPLPQTVALDDMVALDVLSGEEVTGEVVLAGYGIRILRRPG
jgi:beta-galactosidase